MIPSLEVLLHGTGLSRGELLLVLERAGYRVLCPAETYVLLQAREDLQPVEARDADDAEHLERVRWLLSLILDGPKTTAAAKPQTQE